MPAQLSVCVSTCKRPLDATSSGVAPPLPSRHLAGERSLLGTTARQALALQDTDLDFGHVQPARMIRRVVELDPAQQCCGHLYAEHFFEAGTQMRVEIVHHQVNLACLGIPAAQEPTDKANEVDLGAPGGDLRKPALTARLDGDKDVAGAGPLVLVVLFGRCSRLGRQGATSVTQQLLALLVQTNYRLAWIVGASIQSQQVVHTPAILCGELANAPHQLPPGFEEVFFRI